MTDTPLLRVSDLTKSFSDAGRRIDVLNGVSLHLDAGQSLALTGESGSGKSTLLHLIAGLEAPDDGVIEIGGLRTDTLDDAGRARLRRSDVGLVFQQFNLIPSLSVGDNIAFQAQLAGRYDGALVKTLADQIGVADQLGKYPEALSGGQQQRVAIARTLAARPKLVLADEPTGNLDEPRADAVLDMMLRIVRDTGTALVMVTHSRRLAERLDRVAHLSRGRIVA